ncbi:TlpA family protein disulfide reductase [Enhygromyxa salina]|uniref:TlpA family protein disulfide reductase n=1 Tax=Enhygromyxa salina TaxID=215803 RepID=UPI0013FD080D|nr:TlpA disulfide reductase family protein [Enhygromyxa salina]
MLTSSLMAGSGCKSQPSQDEAAKLEPAPTFETKNLAGDDVSLADLKGHVVLLNVWATWCDPCVRELPELARMHESLQHRQFTVIGLNTDVRSKLAAVRTMVARHDLPFPIWLDFESKSQVALELRGYPTSFLIDRQGNIRWKREGEITKNDPELGAVLETVLAE